MNEFLRLDCTNNPSFDFISLFTKWTDELAEHDIKLYQHNPIDGIDELSPLLEEFIPKGTNTPTIKALFHDYFDELQAKDASKLTIIDPYLFAPNTDVTYQNLLIDIISYFTSLTEILFITTSSSNYYDQNLYSRISSGLSVVPSINRNNQWHDRYWIIDDLKGIMVGSSLNGLGKRHSLIAKLDNDDVSAILAEL